jgi:Uncharacterized conserved protein
MTAATLFAALGLQAAYLTAPIKIDTRFVGDAGNAADTGGTVGAGAVAYDYYIGTTEVTAGQYTAFLNAMASTNDVNGLYNTNMYSNANGCGIQRTGNATDGYTYTATKGDNMPVNFVSVYDAMRFCNWLTSGNTETGVYVFTGANDITLVTRNDAAWQAGGIAIASLDEWYKAAFYQGNGTYSMYANGTNTPNPADANYLDTGIGTITDVDFGAASHYGTYGQNGNVWEWIDTVTGSVTDIYLRGGDFDSAASALRASTNSLYTAADESYGFGFRVSSLSPIPEPSTYAAIFGALALAVAAYRKRLIAPKK